MKRSNDHFLDSNILIGKVLQWDTAHSDCSIYFSSNYNKNISDKVYEECETVFSRFRRGQKRFIREFLNFFGDKDILSFDRSLTYFTKKFVREKAEYFQLNIEKFRKIITNFVNECRNDIFQSVIDQSVIFCQKIDRAFDSAIDELDQICLKGLVTLHPGFPKSYSSHYPGVTIDITNLGIHYKDALIIMDSHHLRMKFIKNDLIFVTSDKTILHHTNNIEKLLPGLFVSPLT